MNNQFNNQSGYTPSSNGFNDGGYTGAQGGFNNGGFNNGYNNGYNNGGFNNGFNNRPNLPMNWYGFLVYFALWAGALGSLISAILYFTGGIYSLQGGSARAVYWMFPSMQFFDILYAILCLAGVVLSVCTAISLLGYRRNGPGMLLLLYVFNGGAGVLYNLLSLFVLASKGISGAPIIGSIFGGIIGAVVMILINKTYFDKRSHMFNR